MKKTDLAIPAIPLAVIIKVGLLCLLILIPYYSALEYLWRVWKSEDYNHCYLIPLISLYLIWEKRQLLAKMESAPTWKGLSLVLVAIFLYFLGELGGEYYSMQFSFWLLIIGLCWLLMGGRKLKIIAFPLAILVTAIPFPWIIHANLTLRLKLISSQLGVILLHFYGMSAYREGNVIDLGFTQLQVVDACSGLRYLFPLVVMGILLAYFYRTALWKRLVLVLSTIPLTIVINSLRIALTGVIYAHFGAAAAEGFFHGFSGWLIFVISLFILVAEMKVLCLGRKAFGKDGWFAILQTSDSKVQTSDSRHKTSDIRPRTEDLKPGTSDIKRQTADSRHQTSDLKLKTSKLKPNPQFIVASVLLILTLGISAGVEFREKIPSSKPFSQFPLAVGTWEGTRQYMEQNFITELDLSDYTMIDFKSGGKHIDFYVAYYESQRKGESIHSPESCLPGSGWEFKQAGKAQVALQDGRRVATVNRAIMEKGGYRQLSYFWFPARGRILTNAYEMKIYTFWDALTRQRTDGALVRLITPVLQGEQVENAEKRLQEFTKLILPVLEEFIPK